jgi:hypothetical protein
MAMGKSALKSLLKTKLVALYEKCNEGEGVSADEYADSLADIIADIVPYIKGNATVSTTVTGTAGTFNVTGTGTGTVS